MNITSHLCNCKYCDKKTPCLICGRFENLHRAHIIPRYLVAIILPESLRDEWMSFEGRNIFILCGKHHREFDSYTLAPRDLGKIRDFVVGTINEFMPLTYSGFETNLRGVRAIDKWADRNNKFLYGGGRVLSFNEEKAN